MQTIYAFSYNPVIATGTNTTGTNWRMAYQQPIMLYKGTTNQFRLVVFSVNQKVVDLSNYNIQVQLVDKETQEHFVTKTASITTPTSGVATVTFTEQDLRNLQHRFYHLIARLVDPDDGSTITSSEILYLDDNYGAFTPVTIENAWNFAPSTITTTDGPLLNVGNIIPIDDNLYWLGNVTNRWAHFHTTTANIANISITDGQIAAISNRNIKFVADTQILEFSDNSTDSSHNQGDGGFITFYDSTHLNDGPKFEVWYGDPDNINDPPGQHSLDIRAPDANSYVELASHDLNTFIGIKNDQIFMQINWNNDPEQGWIFKTDGSIRLSRQGMFESFDGDVNIAVNNGFIDFNTIDAMDNTHQTRFDVSGDVYFGGHLLPGDFTTPLVTPLYSLGSSERPWKDLYVSNSAIYLGNVALSVDNTGNLLVNGNIVNGATDNITNGNASVVINVDNTLSIPGTIEFPDSSIQETAYRFASTEAAPSTTAGSLWFNSNEGKLYVSYNNTWVDASPTQIDPSALRADSNGSVEFPSGLSFAPISNFVPANGTVIQQTPGEYISLVASDNGAAMSIGWLQNIFDAGDVASITFNEFPGQVRVVTGTYGNVVHTWNFQSDGNLTLPDNGTISYTPNVAGDWAGTPPTTIQEAIDRLAAAFKILNSGTGA